MSGFLQQAGGTPCGEGLADKLPTQLTKPASSSNSPPAASLYSTNLLCVCLLFPHLPFSSYCPLTSTTYLSYLPPLHASLEPSCNPRCFSLSIVAKFLSWRAVPCKPCKTLLTKCHSSWREVGLLQQPAGVDSHMCEGHRGRAGKPAEGLLSRSKAHNWLHKLWPGARVHRKRDNVRIIFGWLGLGGRPGMWGSVQVSSGG